MSSTRLIIAPTNQDYTIPGTFNADQIKGMYASTIPGIQNMVATSRVEGDVTILTFNNPTGTKGC